MTLRTGMLGLLPLCLLFGGVLVVSSDAHADPCMVGTGALKGNCCWTIEDKRCYGPPHDQSKHFNHKDTECTITVHRAGCASNFLVITLAGCDGQALCPVCDRITHDARGCDGPAAGGRCPNWVYTNLVLDHSLAACQDCVYPTLSDCVHDVVCSYCGHTIYDN
jgi:hypothetical protein